MPRTDIYIPIEIKHRELYSKVLLAARAVRKGFTVTLGRKSELNNLVLRMPPGVYYGLGTVRNFAELFGEISRRGHLIVVSDEEGLVTHSDDMYLDLKVSEETLQVVDLLFAWGADNSNVIAAGRPEAAAKLRITGNPRFDLLQEPHRRIYDAEVAEISRRYPKYVLVCTSFGSCNHYIRGLDYVESLVEKKVLTTQASIDNYRRFQQVKMVAWRAFLDAIPRIAERYPDTHVVVRPHPSEDASPYHAFANAHDNVSVEGGMSIHPWLLGARAVVHHYCTSAVETFAAGTPGFALRPTRDPAVEKETPFMCSQICESPAALVEALRDSLSGAVRLSRPPMPHAYANYVKNIDQPTAADRIVDEISAAVNIARPPTSAGATFNRRHRGGVASMTHALRRAASLVVPSRRATKRYLSHKVDGVTRQEVQRILTVFAPGESASFRCDAFEDNVVCIRPAGAPR